MIPRLVRLLALRSGSIPSPSHSCDPNIMIDSLCPYTPLFGSFGEKLLKLFVTHLMFGLNILCCYEIQEINYGWVKQIVK